MLTRAGDRSAAAGPRNAKERLYERMRIPLRLLDLIIFFLVLLLAAAFLIGYLTGTGPGGGRTVP